MDTTSIPHKSPYVSLYDAKTGLSNLVERAARGEQMIIAKNGVTMAKLVPIPFRGEPRKPANAMGVSNINDEDFFAADEEIRQIFEESACLELLLDTHI
jgi:prevent-host-death family protein